MAEGSTVPDPGRVEEGTGSFDFGCAGWRGLDTGTVSGAHECTHSMQGPFLLSVYPPYSQERRPFHLPLVA